MITLRHLHTFLAVAECGNMSAAARQLFISQPTVSQIISEIEHEYEVILFERYPRGLLITPTGKLFLEYATSVINSLDTLEQAMRSSSFLLPLRVGATLTIGSTILSPMLDTLRRSDPNIDLRVMVDNTANIERMILHNEIDIALVEGIIVREEIITEPVMTDEMVLICGREHPFAAKDSVTPQELKNQRFILREQGSGTRAMLISLMAEHQIPIDIRWECCSSTAIQMAVAYHHGLSFLSRRCVVDMLENGLLHPLKIRGFDLKRHFHLAYHQNKALTSQMQAFMALAREVS